MSNLKAALEAAVKDEDYLKAARLRDAIQHSQVNDRMAVEDANDRFYSAFRSGSLQQMAAVWGSGDHVQVIHPGLMCISGSEAVLESWKMVLAGVRPNAFKIDVEDCRIFASGSSGFVTCTEVVDADDSTGRICATNVFEKQNGRWVIVHHHGSPAPTARRRR